MITQTQVMPSQDGIQGAVKAAIQVALTLNSEPQKEEIKKSVIRVADIPAILGASQLIPRLPDDIWN